MFFGWGRGEVVEFGGLSCFWSGQGIRGYRGDLSYYWSGQGESGEVEGTSHTFGQGRGSPGRLRGPLILLVRAWGLWESEGTSHVFGQKEGLRSD